MSETGYYQKCLDLCIAQRWNATACAIGEEGREGDGTDWKALYEDWSKDVDK